MELKTSMLSWQEQAVEKLIHLRVGALYMEMGTGKTRTALELIKRRLDEGKIVCVLWLCPCNVKGAIAAEIKKHTNGADMILIKGIESLSGSRRLYGELMQYIAGRDVMLVVDESNLVKNHEAIRSRRIISIAEQCKYRIILNGTPISKNEKDLFAQWYLLDWRILGYQRFWSFAANHLEFDPDRPGWIRRVLHVDYLTDKIAPYSFLVKKSDCIALPKKIYYMRMFCLTKEQDEHYDEVKENYLDTLLSSDTAISATALYRAFTALQEVTSGRRIISDPCMHIEHMTMFARPEDNPRIQCLLQVIGETTGKSVIWCKYSHEITDIADTLSKEFGKDSVALFYGEMSQLKRMQALEQFQGNARFLIANKTCAGYGLNLQFCHNSIYFNNDWDWSTRAQSEDRIHRIGQESETQLYDIFAFDTIDQRILRCLDRKESLSDEFKRNIKKKNLSAWIDGGEDDDQAWVKYSGETASTKRLRNRSQYQKSGRVLAAALRD
ncbi:MAG: DEAD/DEAH box helicase [Clostridia bacterium]